MLLPRLLASACLLATATLLQAQPAENPPSPAEAPVQGGNVRYVDDVLTITVRTGRGTDFQIIRTIESGLRLQLLESGDDGYSRVRLPDGTTGWVLTRYLSRERPARERLAAAEQTAEAARATATTATQRAQTLAAENEALQAEVTRLHREREQLDTELSELRARMGDPESAPARLERLRARVQTLSAENESLRTTNMGLRAQSERTWFLTGAGVLFGGMILGLILPRLRPRKRSSSWGSL